MAAEGIQVSAGFTINTASFADTDFNWDSLALASANIPTVRRYPGKPIYISKVTPAETGLYFLDTDLTTWNKYAADSALQYIGSFDPANPPTPQVIDGTTDYIAGNLFVCNVAGFYNFTTGDQTPDGGGDNVSDLSVGDIIVLNPGATWEVIESVALVQSVNGKVGVVVLVAADIGVTAAGRITATDIQAALEQLDTLATAGGAGGEVQFNDGAGGLGGSAFFTYSEVPALVAAIALIDPSGNGANIQLGVQSGLAGIVAESPAGRTANLGADDANGGTLILQNGLGATFFQLIGGNDCFFNADKGLRMGDTGQASNDVYLDLLSVVNSMGVPKGTTAQRPAVGIAGMFRFNTDLQEYEGYDGTQWGALGGGNAILEDRAMFDSNLDTVRVMFFDGILTFGNFEFDSVVLASVNFETSADGITWVDHGSIIAGGTPPGALNTWITTNGSGKWYLRLSVVYKSGQTITTGTQFTFIRP